MFRAGILNPSIVLRCSSYHEIEIIEPTNLKCVCLCGRSVVVDKDTDVCVPPNQVTKAILTTDNEEKLKHYLLLNAIQDTTYIPVVEDIVNILKSLCTYISVDGNNYIELNDGEYTLLNITKDPINILCYDGDVVIENIDGSTITFTDIDATIVIAANVISSNINDIINLFKRVKVSDALRSCSAQ